MTQLNANNAQILGVIVAGGASRRMGGTDKFRLSLAGKTILDHIIERLSPQVDRLILNTNAENIEQNIEVVPDIIEKAGPLGGLYTALSFAKSQGYAKIITTPSDTPFIPHDFAAKLSAQPDHPIIVAKSAGRIHPVLALWDVSLLADIESALQNNQLKMMIWIEKYAPREVIWHDDPDPFFNINTPDDLTRAEALISQDNF